MYVLMVIKPELRFIAQKFYYWLLGMEAFRRISDMAIGSYKKMHLSYDVRAVPK